MAYSKIKRSDLTFGDEIGRGGFSTVYQATLRQSWFPKKEVAVKKVLKMEQNEVEILSKLDHVNIVKLIGVVDEKPDLYLILELCKGGSLRKYLDKRNGKRLPDDQFYDWAKQAASAIEYLKKMGVVHKDVKASNYVIADNLILKLTDFGLAKEIDVTKSNASGSGTYGFMTPELMKDFILSPTYDIFSYGVVLFELWTTDTPFKGEDQYAIVWKVCKNNEHPPIPADCPRPIADLMMQCWNVDWKSRPEIGHVLTVISETEAVAAAAKTARQRQLLNGPWVLERKIGEKDGPGKLTSPVGVAINPNGDIIATNFIPGHVHLYSAMGDHKMSLDTNQDSMTPGRISYAHDVIASSNGNSYYVTDFTQFVHCYDVNGLYKGKWVAISPQGKPSHSEYTWLRGLAIDANDQLLVGEVNTKYISKHRSDGSHVASFKVDIKPHSLAVTSQGTTIVNDWLNDLVHIVDNVGHLLHVIQPPAEMQNWTPSGITCYSDIICICDNQNGIICCFSLSGEYLGSVPIEIPSLPRCLTFTTDGKKLLVAYGYHNIRPPCGIAVYKLQE